MTERALSPAIRSGLRVVYSDSVAIKSHRTATRREKLGIPPKLSGSASLSESDYWLKGQKA